MKNTKTVTLLICIFTLLNTLLCLITKIYDRQSLIKAVKDDKTVTLIKAKQKTEIL